MSRFKETMEVDTPKGKPLKRLAVELEDSVLQLCRHPRYGASLGRAKTYIIKKLQEYGYQVFLQEFYNPYGKFYNITAERKGTEPGRYVIGAHYDAEEPVEEDTSNPGADDNASSVAVLLAVAKRLPRRPKRTVELVFYACEESPFSAESNAFMGSYAHAAECTPEEVTGMIALDMLGVYGDEPITMESRWVKLLKPLLPKHGNFIAVCGDANADTVNLAKTAQYFLSDYICAVRVNMPPISLPRTEIGTTRLFDSDHCNYRLRGIPAIMISDTADLRNQNYHGAADTPDTLNYTMMARVAWGILDILKYVAW